MNKTRLPQPFLAGESRRIEAENEDGRETTEKNRGVRVLTTAEGARSMINSDEETEERRKESAEREAKKKDVEEGGSEV